MSEYPAEPAAPPGRPGPTGPPGRPWSGNGREELADAVRRLMALTVTAAAPPEVLADAARRAGTLAGELEGHVPPAGSGPVARYADQSAMPQEAVTLAAAMPFDVVIGSCNPVAPPVEVSFEQPLAVGRVSFTAHYEGAPGCVHGAVIAGAFDIILTAANVMAGAAGPTVSLSLRYRKPTLIDQPVRFEAWVTERTARRTHSRGRLLQGEVVTVEAEGVFATLDRSRIESMHRRGRSSRARRPDSI
jgi:acyl-coenzyme A thioesterase PaaI-like protein